jgi:Flp pilus assembly protein TadG
MRFVYLMCRRVRRNRRGAVALEFALLAPIFFVLVMGILETAIMFGASIVVDGAVNDSARSIRTGQAQLSGDPITTFRTRLCDSLVAFVTCNEMTFDVRTFADFNSISLTVSLDENGDPVDENGNVIVQTFNPGGAGDIVMVRVVYIWDFITPLIGQLYNPGGTNSVMLVSSTVFRTEPFEGL